MTIFKETNFEFEKTSTTNITEVIRTNNSLLKTSHFITHVNNSRRVIITRLNNVLQSLEVQSTRRLIFFIRRSLVGPGFAASLEPFAQLRNVDSLSFFFE